MNAKEITSSSNQLVKQIKALAQADNRKQAKLFLIEGKKLLAEAVSQKLNILDILVSKSSYGEMVSFLQSIEPAGTREAVYVLDDNVFKTVCTTTSPCEVIATAVMPTFSLQEILSSPKPVLVMAESLQDPGNLGTIIRTAFAFGATGLLLTRGSTDRFNPKVVRAAMGALFSLPIVSDVELIPCLELLQERQIRIVALDAKASKPYWQETFQDSAVYLFGNEGAGLSETALALSDAIITIPMADACESLNVAVCVGIILSYASFSQQNNSK